MNRLIIAAAVLCMATGIYSADRLAEHPTDTEALDGLLSRVLAKPWVTPIIQRGESEGDLIVYQIPHGDAENDFSNLIAKFNTLATVLHIDRRYGYILDTEKGNTNP